MMGDRKPNRRRPSIMTWLKRAVLAATAINQVAQALQAILHAKG